MGMKLVVKTTLKFRWYIVIFDIQGDSLNTYILHDLLIDIQLVCEISMVHIKKKITQTIHIHSYIGTYNRDINLRIFIKINFATKTPYK